MRVLQGKPCGVRVWVCREGHLEHRLGEREVEVESILQSCLDVLFCQVQAVAVEEAMVCERVHHGTGAACYVVSVECFDDQSMLFTNHRCQEQDAIRLAEIGPGRKRCPQSRPTAR